MLQGRRGKYKAYILVASKQIVVCPQGKKINLRCWFLLQCWKTEGQASLSKRAGLGSPERSQQIDEDQTCV